MQVFIKDLTVFMFASCYEHGCKVVYRRYDPLPQMWTPAQRLAFTGLAGMVEAAAESLPPLPGPWLATALEVLVLTHQRHLSTDCLQRVVAQLQTVRDKAQAAALAPPPEPRPVDGKRHKAATEQQTFIEDIGRIYYRGWLGCKSSQPGHRSAAESAALAMLREAAGRRLQQLQ